MNRRDDRVGLSTFTRMRLGEINTIMADLYNRDYPVRKVRLSEEQLETFRAAKERGMVPVGFDLVPEIPLPQPVDLSNRGQGNTAVDYTEDGVAFLTDTQFTEPYERIFNDAINIQT